MGEAQRGTVRIPPCQNLNIFPLGLQKPGSFWEFKKKVKVSTNGYRYQTDVGLEGLHRRPCIFMRARSIWGRKKSLAQQLSSVVSLTAPFNSLYLSPSLRAMCRESRVFPTETKFLLSDPPPPPLFPPPSISVFLPLSCERKQPDPKHPSFITVGSKEEKKPTWVCCTQQKKRGQSLCTHGGSHKDMEKLPLQGWPEVRPSPCNLPGWVWQHPQTSGPVLSTCVHSQRRSPSAGAGPHWPNNP